MRATSIYLRLYEYLFYKILSYFLPFSPFKFHDINLSKSNTLSTLLSWAWKKFLSINGIWIFSIGFWRKKFFKFKWRQTRFIILRIKHHRMLYYN